MKICGDLKVYYDVLDEMGAIEPLLKNADWNQLQELKEAREEDFEELLTKINQLSNEKQQIKRALGCYDSQMILFFAMEVAKEFADFQNNKQYH
ncbi:MAG: hypothetical protein M9899_03160 [Bdellovibrionaceae bacterium]|nr:hypothetical protein [Pseudobdellovibrionaceae bacterium]